MGRLLISLFLLLAVSLPALAGCGKKGPEAISFGSDNCAGCGMVASDARYGAELISRKGKILKFDSVECLAGFLDKKGTGAEPGSLWVEDFAHGQLIDAAQAFYLKSDKLHSPMGLNVAAFATKESATALQGECPGTILTWPELLKYAGQKRS